MKRWFKILCATLGLMACDKDMIGPQEVNPGPKPVLEGRHILVINEGNFGSGNASVSAYNPETEQVQHNVYSGFNENTPMGDVLQDVQQYRGRYYLVMNNSGKVITVDTLSLKNIGEIDGLQNPRYISFYEDRAFVTELYAKKLKVINVNTMKVEQEIAMPESGFHTTVWNDKIWVGSKQYLVRVSAETLDIDSTYTLRKNVERMAVDHQNRMWVLTTEAPSHLYRLSQGGVIEEDWTFGSDKKPLYLEVSPDGRHLYFVMDDAVFRQNVGVSSFQPEKVLNFAGQNVYGFDVDPESGELYLADALDYNQPSTIYRYSHDGVLLDQFKAGVISNGFCFGN